MVVRYEEGTTWTQYACEDVILNVCLHVTSVHGSVLLRFAFHPVNQDIVNYSGTGLAEVLTA